MTVATRVRRKEAVYAAVAQDPDVDVTIGMTQVASIPVRNEDGFHAIFLQSLEDSRFPLEEDYFMQGYRERSREKNEDKTNLR